jgi:hypothetical protein
MVSDSIKCRRPFAGPSVVNCQNVYETPKDALNANPNLMP